MSSPRCSAITLRLSFIVGVSSPDSSVKSEVRMRNWRTDSAFETAEFPSSTAAWISARRSSSPASSSAVVPDLPCSEAQSGSASGSRVISAAM